MGDKNPKHPPKKKKVQQKTCVAGHSSEEEMSPKSKKHVYN